MINRTSKLSLIKRLSSMTKLAAIMSSGPDATALPKITKKEQTPPNMSRTGPNRTLKLDRRAPKPESPSGQVPQAPTLGKIKKAEYDFSTGGLANAISGVHRSNDKRRLAYMRAGSARNRESAEQEVKRNAVGKDLVQLGDEAHTSPAAQKAYDARKLGMGLRRAVSGRGPMADKPSPAGQPPSGIKMAPGMGYNWLAKKMGGGLTGSQLREQMGGRMLLAGKTYSPLSSEQLAAARQSKGVGSRFGKKSVQPSAVASDARKPTSPTRPADYFSEPSPRETSQAHANIRSVMRGSDARKPTSHADLPTRRTQVAAPTMLAPQKTRLTRTSPTSTGGARVGAFLGGPRQPPSGAKLAPLP